MHLNQITRRRVPQLESTHTDRSENKISENAKHVGESFSTQYPPVSVISRGYGGSVLQEKQEPSNRKGTNDYDLQRDHYPRKNETPVAIVATGSEQGDNAKGKVLESVQEANDLYQRLLQHLQLSRGNAKQLLDKRIESFSKKGLSRIEALRILAKEKKI